MIVGVESFLYVKPGANDPAGGIVNSQMEMPELSRDPFVGSRVHLEQFAEIGASGTSRVGILDRDDIFQELYFFFCSPGVFLGLAEEAGDPLFLAFVTLGERMALDSRMEVTEATDTWICSWVSKSSVKCEKFALKYLF